MDLEVGVSLEDIAVEEVHKYRLARRRGSRTEGRCGAHEPDRKDEQQHLAECTILDSVGAGRLVGGVGKDKKIQRIDKIKWSTY